MSVVQIVSERTVVVEGGTRTELTIATPGPPGPPGPQGPEGPQGPPGPAGAAREEVFHFAVPSTVWEVTHDLPVTPSVYAHDLNEDIIEGDVSYPAPDTVRVEWAWPMAGRLVITT